MKSSFALHATGCMHVKTALACQLQEQRAAQSCPIAHAMPLRMPMLWQQSLHLCLGLHNASAELHADLAQSNAQAPSTKECRVHVYEEVKVRHTEAAAMQQPL